MKTETQILIIGAGPAGLGAANFARENGLEYLVLEKNQKAGGHCSSFDISGIVFDEGPHISFTKNQIVKDLFQKNCPELFCLTPRMLNHWKGYEIPHPVQSHLAYLPEDVQKASYDSIRQAQLKPEIKNYHDWLESQFGNYFTENFYELYTKKYWTTATSNLTAEWVGERIVVPDIAKIEKGLFEKKVHLDSHYFTEYRYPQKGGFESFLLPNWSEHSGNALYDTRVVQIDSKNKLVLTEDDRQIRYNQLVSSLPLNLYGQFLIDDKQNYQQYCEKLNCSSVTLYSVVYKAQRAPQVNWGYVYDQDIVFSRYYYPSTLMNNESDELQGIQLEVYSSLYRPNSDDWNNLDNVIQGCEKLGLVSKKTIIDVNIKHLPFANVIFDHNCTRTSDQIISNLNKISIYPIGRYGKWRYLWSDDSYLDGYSTIKNVTHS